MTQKLNPWALDTRVRERNLKNGHLTEKELEKHLASLPDVADHAEAFAVPQPALAPPEIDDEEDDADGEGEGDVPGAGG